MSQKAADASIVIGWCGDPALAVPVADLFVAHAEVAYISHSELQFGRAEAPDRWAPDLHARVVAQARRAMADPHGRSLRVALAQAGETILGFAFVSFTDGLAVPFATLEDIIVVPAARGGGIGARLIDWIVEECRALGVRRLFLESGRHNHRAHHLFERTGFEQTSIVMMRDI